MGPGLNSLASLLLCWFNPEVCCRYVLKTDDDVFVNPGALIHFLRNGLSSYGARRLILCQYHVNGLVRRSYRSKWRVSYSEYPGRFYPPYCQGWAVLYSPDVVFQLYKESQMSSYFWIDDVFVTGKTIGIFDTHRVNIYLVQ